MSHKPDALILQRPVFLLVANHGERASLLAQVCSQYSQHSPTAVPWAAETLNSQCSHSVSVLLLHMSCVAERKTFLCLLKGGKAKIRHEDEAFEQE